MSQSKEFYVRFSPLQYLKGVFWLGLLPTRNLIISFVLCMSCFLLGCFKPVLVRDSAQMQYRQGHSRNCVHFEECLFRHRCVC